MVEFLVCTLWDEAEEADRPGKSASVSVANVLSALTALHQDIQCLVEELGTLSLASDFTVGGQVFFTPRCLNECGAVFIVQAPGLEKNGADACQIATSSTICYQYFRLPLEEIATQKRLSDCSAGATVGETPCQGSHGSGHEPGTGREQPRNTPHGG